MDIITALLDVTSTLDGLTQVLGEIEYRLNQDGRKIKSNTIKQIRNNLLSSAIQSNAYKYNYWYGHARRIVMDYWYYII
jgi:hypothetical protein